MQRLGSPIRHCWRDYDNTNSVKRLFAFAIILSILSCTNLFGQHNISGYIIDSSNSEPLAGAYIICHGENISSSDLNGHFNAIVPSNADSIKISFLGYFETSIFIKAKSNLGYIPLKENSKSLPDVTVTAQLAVPRKTPVAASTIQRRTISERLGNDALTEVLKFSPGIHANHQGGGWGDSEIFMRGFDNSNIAVMVNGIPVNDMENGSLYWSNWEGLGEFASLVQAQRGIGASKVSSPSVGGTINISTPGLVEERKLSASYSIGNNAYNKVAFSINSGLLKNGWAVSLYGSKSQGDGNAMGLDFVVYNYFANITKLIGNNHHISFTAFGSPQKHHMRSSALTANEWDKVKSKYSYDGHWSNYNPEYGFNQSGVRKSTDYNSYHKPFISLKHIWQIKDKASLNTTVFASFGRGYSYSGLANSDTYSEYDLYGADNGILNTKFRCTDGTFDYGAVENINSISADGSELIITKTNNDQDWYGLVSSYSDKAFDCIDWFAGIDIRYCKSLHSNTIADLLGGQYFIDPSRKDVAQTNNQNASDDWKSSHLGVGDVVYRDYDANIAQQGVFGQAEYSTDKINAFVSGALNYSSYWRVDRFYYDNVKSSTIGFWGGNIKLGANYKISQSSNLFCNFGFNSKAPQFKSGAFMSATSSNVTNDLAKNEKSISSEIGYMYRANWLTIKANAYFAKWIDKSMTKKGKLTEQYYINMSGVNSKHVGIEFEALAKPTSWFEAEAMLSVGNWKWDSDKVTGYAYNILGQAITPSGSVTTPGAADHAWATINMSGIHVGGSAQTTVAVNATFNPFEGCRIGGGYTYYARNYAYYALSGNSLSLGKELFVNDPWKLPNHGSFDAWASYCFKLGKSKAIVSAQAQNILNKHFIEKAWNPSSVSKEKSEVNPDDVFYFLSTGATWCVNLRFEF